MAMRFIQKHPKMVAHAFHIAKEEEKEPLIIDRLSKDNVYPISEINNPTNS